MSRSRMFDADRVENDWRTTPTDLGGWANRANAMLLLVKRYHDALLYIARDADDPKEVARKALEA